jgi:hypothetical protein
MNYKNKFENKNYNNNMNTINKNDNENDKNNDSKIKKNSLKDVFNKVANKTKRNSSKLRDLISRIQNPLSEQKLQEQENNFRSKSNCLKIFKNKLRNAVKNEFNEYMENLNNIDDNKNDNNNKDYNNNIIKDIKSNEIQIQQNDLLEGVTEKNRLSIFNKYIKEFLLKYEKEKDNDHNENDDKDNINENNIDKNDCFIQENLKINKNTSDKNEINEYYNNKIPLIESPIKFLRDISSKKNKDIRENSLEKNTKNPSGIKPTNKIFKVFHNYLKASNLIDEMNTNKLKFEELNENDKFIKNPKIKNLTVKEKIELLCLEFYYDYICSTKVQREKILMKKYSILRRDKKKLLKISLQIKLREKDNKLFNNNNKDDYLKGNESPYFNNNINSTKISINSLNFTEEEIKELDLLEKRIAYLKNCQAENKNSNSYSFVNNIYKFIFSFQLFNVKYKDIDKEKNPFYNDSNNINNKDGNNLNKNFSFELLCKNILKFEDLINLSDRLEIDKIIPNNKDLKHIINFNIFIEEFLIHHLNFSVIKEKGTYGLGLFPFRIGASEGKSYGFPFFNEECTFDILINKIQNENYKEKDKEKEKEKHSKNNINYNNNENNYSKEVLKFKNIVDNSFNIKTNTSERDFIYSSNKSNSVFMIIKSIKNENKYIKIDMDFDEFTFSNLFSNTKNLKEIFDIPENLNSEPNEIYIDSFCYKDKKCISEKGAIVNILLKIQEIFKFYFNREKSENKLSTNLNKEITFDEFHKEQKFSHLKINLRNNMRLIDLWRIRKSKKNEISFNVDYSTIEKINSK